MVIIHSMIKLYSGTFFFCTNDEIVIYLILNILKQFHTQQ